jgi:hypothetical protein
MSYLLPRVHLLGKYVPILTSTVLDTLIFFQRGRGYIGRAKLIELSNPMFYCSQKKKRKKVGKPIVGEASAVPSSSEASDKL